MKRITLAVISVLALALAACGGDTDETAADADADADAAEAAVEDSDDNDGDADDADADDGDTADDAEDASDEEDADAEDADAEDGATDDEDTAVAAESCAVDHPALYESGQLTVSTSDPVFPPWMLDDDPESGEGFENGLVYALASELGFEHDDVVWERETFEEAIAPGPKPYDFGIQQISVTEERAEVVDFSTIYLESDKAVIALPDSPVAEATSLEELAEAEWGATLGTTDLDYIEQTIGDDEVAVFDDQAAAFQALLGGQIDATVAALATAIYVTDVQVPEAEITALLPPDGNDPGHGLLFEQGSELVDCINEGLDAVIAAGVVDDLVDEYLIGDADIPEISS